jgi:predicted transcriptional regulator
MNRALFLSIRPKFVNRILNGYKKVELRRVRPNVTGGDLLLIYASSPQKELKGYSIVSKVSRGRPKKLWSKFRDAVGLSRAEFKEYFYGVDVGFAIHFGPVYEFESPISLKFLREIWPGFRPPQIYRYFSPDEYSHLLDFKANRDILFS